MRTCKKKQPINTLYCESKNDSQRFKSNFFLIQFSMTRFEHIVSVERSLICTGYTSRSPLWGHTVPCRGQHYRSKFRDHPSASLTLTFEAQKEKTVFLVVLLNQQIRTTRDVDRRYHRRSKCVSATTLPLNTDPFPSDSIEPINKQSVQITLVSDPVILLKAGQ